MKQIVIDILENKLHKKYPHVLDLLLFDYTRKKIFLQVNKKHRNHIASGQSVIEHSSRHDVFILCQNQFSKNNF